MLMQYILTSFPKYTTSTILRLFLIDYNSFLLFLFGLILIAPSPKFVAAIARSFDTFADHFFGYRLQVVSQSHPRHYIDEECREINAEPTQFGCFVVPGECVVVIVPTLTNSED